MRVISTAKTRALVVAAGLAVLAAVALAMMGSGAEYDFVFDWLTSKAFIGGIDPFQPLNTLATTFDVPHITTSWVHPRAPGALLLQAPIGWLPYDWVYPTGRMLTVASAFVLAWVVARLGRFSTSPAFLGVPILLLVWPFSTVLHYSQVGFLIAALIGATYLLGDRWAAGIPLGVAVVMKLWPWLLVPALWLMGRRKAAGGAVASFVALNAIGLAFPHVRLEAALDALSAARGLDSSSLVGDLPIWLIAVTGLTAVFLVSRVTTDVFWWSIPIALLLAPVIWTHYLPALVLVVVVIVGRFAEARITVDAKPTRESDYS